MKRTRTHDEMFVRRRLKRMLKREGCETLAKQVNYSALTIDDMANGRLWLGKRILRLLGFRRVSRYERIPPVTSS